MWRIRRKAIPPSRFHVCILVYPNSVGADITQHIQRETHMRRDGRAVGCQRPKVSLNCAAAGRASRDHLLPAPAAWTESRPTGGICLFVASRWLALRSDLRDGIQFMPLHEFVWQPSCLRQGELTSIKQRHGATPRMDFMVNGNTDVRRTRTFRWLSRCLAALMMFAQLSAVAAICPDYVAGVRGGHEACAHELGQRQGTNDQLCASEFVPANQLAAINPVVEVPGLALPLEVAALWPAAPAVQAPQPRQNNAPSAPVPRFLVFGRLLN